MVDSKNNKKRDSSSAIKRNNSALTGEPLKTIGHRALCGWPMILGWLAMIIFALHASTHMVGAGDTWVALACGRHFINHGVNTVEPFSANSHKAGPTQEEIKTWPNWAQWITYKVGIKTVKYWHPTGWVNQNWLTHVMFYWLTTLSPVADAETLSFNTLVYWKFAIYIITVICVYYTGRLLGVNPALSAVFACFAMFVGRSLLDIRPAGFSNLLVAVFLLILVLATYRNILYIWLVVPLTVFWCNVHGGYIYVFIMLMPFVRLHLGAALPKRWVVILNIASFLFFFILLGSKYSKESGTLFLIAFVGLLALAILDFVQVFFRERFVSIGLKGIYHTIAAGLVSLAAAIVFNPFHLTNFTHTFVISVSEHAKMWRTVNEWHPAFEWSNPVGQGFAFLVLFILSIGYLAFRFLIPLLLPSFLKAPKNELEAQDKRFKVLSTIFGYAAAIFICWVTFISFSFVKADAASFLLCAAFVCILLLSIYKSVHFIYIIIGLTLLALWSGDANAGYSGRYIYSFVILPTYVILHILVSLLSKPLSIKYKAINIAFVALAAVASLLLMILIFNPFKFKMPLSNVWEQFLDLRRLWAPEYERNLDITYKYLFDVLYIVNIGSIVTWLSLPYLRKLFGLFPGEKIQAAQIAQYELPKIDLPLMAIAALTIYMAYRSRRFIPIAAIAACPIMAMFIEQIVCVISAARNFYKHRSLSVSPMPYNLQLFFIFAGTVAVITFGTWWGLKFKYVYLDPWPTDARLNSIFMRMTASNVKPFDACKFIRDNKLKGKMFNYWTEGGFIAWGQEPDPNTGRTPLQLFMDGRAQAAYEPSVYNSWSSIMSGGPIAYSALIRKTTPDYAKVGQWINKQLEKRNVWVALMPLSDPDVYNGPFLKSIETDNPNWSLAFFNNKQKLFIDVTTPQGKELFERISNGKALYPDEFSKDLILAYDKLGGTEKKQGLDFAITAFKLKPSQAPLQIILYTARYADLQPLVENFCKNYFYEFAKDKNLYAKQDGYVNRIWAALLTGKYLRAIAAKQGNIELARFYDDKLNEYNDEQEQLIKGKRW
jgi:hypothetical protein